MRAAESAEEHNFWIARTPNAEHRTSNAEVLRRECLALGRGVLPAGNEDLAGF
jgi:hypothetical protein